MIAVREGGTRRRVARWWVFLLALGLLSAGCRHTTELPGKGPQYKPALYRLHPVGPVATPDLAGRVTLVSFFATWCFPCLVELPALQMLQKSYEARGFTVVVVGMDREGSKVLAPFADHYQLPFPVLVATRDMREGHSPYGAIKALPTSVLLGKDGEVLAAWEGVAAPETVAAAVERALER